MGKLVINKKSIILCIIFFSILTFVESRIIDAILKSIHEHNQIYITAQKVDNDANEFKRCIDLKVGNVLAYGTVEAINPVSFSKLNEDFYYIECVTEKYTMHTKPVTKTTGSGKNRHTYTTTETYYKWDTINRDKMIASNISFLNQIIDTSMIQKIHPTRLNINSYIKPEYKNKVKNNYIYKSSTLLHMLGDTRYYFKYIPKSFDCIIEVNTSSGSIKPMTGNSIEVIRMNLDGYMNSILSSESIIKYSLYIISILSSIIISIIISSKININEIHEKERL